jgi:Rps23 Pro-64 3,4-dihydroxylase Tpa1-like proline 4-hydroxylase
MTMLDYHFLERAMLANARRYRESQPFPHIVIDNFLSPKYVSTLLAHFPKPRVKKGQEDQSATMVDGMPAQFRKRWVSREQGVDPAIRRLYWELNSGPFISLLEAMTGIENLLPDPFLLGGGIHQTEPGGFLRVHADFNRHPKLHLDRRLNLLIYFNQNWRPEYGGNLELWSQDLSFCQHEVEPIAGRCVIFNTTSNSWHGHPKPLACPDGESRKSLALYYYTNGRPAEETIGDHDTLWQRLPGEGS